MHRATVRTACTRAPLNDSDRRAVASACPGPCACAPQPLPPTVTAPTIPTRVLSAIHPSFVVGVAWRAARRRASGVFGGIEQPGASSSPHISAKHCALQVIEIELAGSTQGDVSQGCRRVLRGVIVAPERQGTRSTGSPRRAATTRSRRIMSSSLRRDTLGRPIAPGGSTCRRLRRRRLRRRRLLPQPGPRLPRPEPGVRPADAHGGVRQPQLAMEASLLRFFTAGAGARTRVH